jgi:hypothetical protein
VISHLGFLIYFDMMALHKCFFFAKCHNFFIKESTTTSTFIACLNLILMFLLDVLISIKIIITNQRNKQTGLVIQWLKINKSMFMIYI